MKKYLFTLALLMIFYTSKSQKSNVSVPLADTTNITYLKVKPGSYIPHLPEKVNEESGIIFFDELFWTFNDSGGESEIYAINKQGEMVREIDLQNAKNIDWEDIAQDKKHIYIGDFGNNNGVRSNQKIYKLKKSKLNKAAEQKADVSAIRFSFKNQETFHFKTRSTPFDCEAMVEFKGNLYVFTKDWSNETTTVYELPKKEGQYDLNPIQKFNVGCLVTGADISKDKQTLALVGYHDFEPVVWLFKDITKNSFFNGEKIKMDITDMHNAQTEGICFKGKDTIMISCEKTPAFDQQIFYIDLKNFSK